LTRKRQSIVHDLPGVTRDRKEATASFAGISFQLIDTAGVEESRSPSLLEASMQEQTEFAAESADLILFLVDGKSGLTPDDKFFSVMLRKKSRPLVLIVNKCEAKDVIRNASEFYQLGFGEPVLISAEHGEGLAELFEAIYPYYLKKMEQEVDEKAEETAAYIKIAIVGRPNVGKSTFLNKVMGSKRVITSNEAGTTRDAIAVNYNFKGHPITLIDTAGIRKKGSINSDIEKLSYFDSVRAIRNSHVVVVLLDATNKIEAQDAAIISIAAEEGKGIVIAVNKYDLVTSKHSLTEQINEKLEKSFSNIKGVPVVYMSALNNQKVLNVLDTAIQVYQLWNSKISTGKLNSWLAEATSEHELPLAKTGKRIRIKYITQSASRPPTFMMFTTYADQIQDSYRRYLTNNLREKFGLNGIPLRIIFKKGKNPYDNS
jgi:GTP-binding protein